MLDEFAQAHAGAVQHAVEMLGAQCVGAAQGILVFALHEIAPQQIPIALHRQRIHQLVHEPGQVFLLDQGLLPPDLLAKAVREQFIPAQLKK